VADIVATVAIATLLYGNTLCEINKVQCHKITNFQQYKPNHK